jgi:hypothetical protein
MKKRSVIKIDLFVPQLREGQIDQLGDPLAEIEACIDFQALARAVDEAAPRAVSTRVADLRIRRRPWCAFWF